MAEALVLASSPNPSIRILTFNRLEKRNALSQALINDFVRELSIAQKEHAVRVIIVTGGKNFFSAGADIKEISLLNAESARQIQYLADLCAGLKAVSKPLIAAVEGMALGGGFEVALMCDIILASETARFGLPEVTIGLLPGAGGTQRLTAAVGKFRAMQLVLSGAPVAAADALSWGLCTSLHEPGTVLSHAIDLATKICTNSPVAVGLAKEAVLVADSKSQDHHLERALYYFAFGTADKREGVNAFLEKRSPKWD